MIATHNIKVNGVWYRAGDTLPEPKAEKPAVEQIEIQDVPDVQKEKPEKEQPKEAKPQTTARRKKVVKE